MRLRKGMWVIAGWGSAGIVQQIGEDSCLVHWHTDGFYAGQSIVFIKDLRQALLSEIPEWRRPDMVTARILGYA